MTFTIPSKSFTVDNTHRLDPGIEIANGLGELGGKVKIRAARCL